MSRGCVPLVSNSESSINIVKNEKLVFKNRDISNLKEKLEFLIKNKSIFNNLSKQMIEKSKDYSIQKNLSKFEELYSN